VVTGKLKIKKMNDKQKNQFNVMLRALKAISKDFLTPEQLFKNSQKLYGLDYTEALEMAYENCIGVAKANCKNIKEIK
jgi:hypothetical protein